MKRGNPLFVDSTKFQGDQILTRLQARAPYQSDDSHFLAEVRRLLRNDDEVRVPLIFDEEEDLWRGQIYLDHLEPVQVRLILKPESENEAERPGPLVEALGTHIIDLFWVMETSPEISASPSNLG